jgi:hypothetical protein
VEEFTRQAKENAKTVEEEYQYRLRQFYKLLLQADKERMAVFGARVNKRYLSDKKLGGVNTVSY